MAKTTPLHFSGDPEADAFLGSSPLALMIGFVLDQQVTVQKAFSSPLELSKRIGGLDAEEIAAMDPHVLEEAFREKPALHRFPANMARRTQEFCAAIDERVRRRRGRGVDRARDGADLEQPAARASRHRGDEGAIAGGRDREAPRRRVRPAGRSSHPSTSASADVDSAEALAEYQAAKRARKAAMRPAGRPTSSIVN